MSWRIAESLKQLREQVNAAYPNRDKASDGGVGDKDHASRSSDHNPWVKDSRGMGVVTAIDIDEDLTPELRSVQAIVDSIIASRDPRVKYIIYERRICSSYAAHGYKAWTWRPYSGKNPHSMHAHISVNPSPYHYDSRAEWNIGSTPAKRTLAEPVSLEIPPLDERPAPEVEKPRELAATAPAEKPAEEPAQSMSPQSFPAHVPQIDTAKKWMSMLFGGTAIGTAASVIGGLPQWLQIGLFGVAVLIIVGIIVMFVKYHDRIFSYVTGMNTLRATEGVGNPELAGPPA